MVARIQTHKCDLQQSVRRRYKSLVGVVSRSLLLWCTAWKCVLFRQSWNYLLKQLRHRPVMASQFILSYNPHLFAIFSLLKSVFLQLHNCIMSLDSTRSVTDGNAFGISKDFVPAAPPGLIAPIHSATSCHVDILRLSCRIAQSDIFICRHEVAVMKPHFTIGKPDVHGNTLSFDLYVSCERYPRLFTTGNLLENQAAARHQS